MPVNERRRRADNLRRTVESDDVAKWFREQLWDIIRFRVRGDRDPGAVLADGTVVANGVDAVAAGSPRVQVVVSAVKPGGVPT
jgi:hypothetical protein